MTGSAISPFPVKIRPGSALSKAAPESQARERDRWTGSDLILRELATGKELTFGNVSEFAFDKKGRWLAFIIDAMGLTGNGIQLRNMEYRSGRLSRQRQGQLPQPRLDRKGRSARLPQGQGGQGLRRQDAQRHRLHRFRRPRHGADAAAGIQKVIYDPKEDKSFPQGMTISPNRSPQWTEDFDALLFGIHEPKKKQEGATPGPAPDAAAPGAAAGAPPPAAGADEDMPDLVLWHYQDKRLQSQQQVQATSDQNFSYLPNTGSRRRNSSGSPTMKSARSRRRRRASSPWARTTANMSSTRTSTASAIGTSMSST